MKEKHQHQEQEEKQSKYLEYQLYIKKIQELKEYLEALEAHFLELKKLENSLDEINFYRKGKEILVPLGQGVFFKGKIEDTSNVLVNVGSGVVVERDKDGAKELILKQIEEIEKVIADVRENFSDLVNKANDVEKKLQ